MMPTDLFGKFDIDGGTMYAYGPDIDEDRYWRVVYEKDDWVVYQEKIDMLYEPVFGYDAGDIAALNKRVEEIIKELDLE